MTDTVKAQDNAEFHSPVERLEPPKSRLGLLAGSMGFWMGRAVTAIQSSARVTAKIFATVEGTDKAMKIASFALLALQVRFAKVGAPVVTGLAKGIKEGAKFLKIRNFTGCSNYWIQGLYQKDKIVGAASMALLMVAVTCEQAAWLGSLGLVNLGKMANVIAKCPGGSVIGAVSLAQVQMSFALAGVSLAAVSAYLSVREGASNDKHWIKVADNLGKVGLIAFSSFAFSYGYAALGLIASSIGLLKVCYGILEAERKEHEQALKTPRYEPQALLVDLQRA